MRTSVEPYVEVSWRELRRQLLWACLEQLRRHVAQPDGDAGNLILMWRGTFDTLRAARTAGRDWHPIETHVDDGEMVVVWNGQPWRASYHDPEGWFADVEGEFLRIDPEPTHWIPRPK